MSGRTAPGSPNELIRSVGTDGAHGLGSVKPPRAGMFRSLAIRNYRLFFTGNIIVQTGTWANRVAQDWLVLQLTDDDPVALGIATALQFGPTLVLSLWAGTLADRYDKRKLMIWIQSVIGLSVGALGLLDVLGVVAVWHVYAICLIVGMVAALDGPVRQAFVSEVVGPDQVPNAVGLNAMAFNGARIVGPAIAGVGIAVWGTGWVMLSSSLAFVAVLVGLSMMRTAELFPSRPLARGKGQVREGLRYVKRRADIVVVLVLLFIVATFGMNFQITLAIMAKIVFQKDAASYGLLTTALAVGALAGATLSARRQGKPRQRMLIGSALAFGLLEMSLGFITSYEVLAIMLIPQGLFMLLFVNAANATVQLSTPAIMRGRVMGLYTLVFLGGTPFIAPLVGVLAERAGGGAPLIVGGAVSTLGALLLGGWIARSHHVHLEFRMRPVLHVHVANPMVTDVEGMSAGLAHGIHRLTHVGRQPEVSAPNPLVAIKTSTDPAATAATEIAGAAGTADKNG